MACHVIPRGPCATVSVPQMCRCTAWHASCKLHVEHMFSCMTRPSLARHLGSMPVQSPQVVVSSTRTLFDPRLCGAIFTRRVCRAQLFCCGLHAVGSDWRCNVWSALQLSRYYLRRDRCHAETTAGSLRHVGWPAHSMVPQSDVTLEHTGCIPGTSHIDDSFNPPYAVPSCLTQPQQADNPEQHGKPPSS